VVPARSDLQGAALARGAELTVANFGKKLQTAEVHGRSSRKIRTTSAEEHQRRRSFPAKVLAFY
jgi:hypothetical protein